MTETDEVKPVVALNTGRERALRDLAEREAFVLDYYKNTVFLGNKRAAARRLKKAMAKHKRAMELVQKRRYA